MLVERPVESRIPAFSVPFDGVKCQLACKLLDLRVGISGVAIDTPLPAKIYANEGVAQVVFFESDDVCETSYKDRGGKYQGQRGVTLPKM